MTPKQVKDWIAEMKAVGFAKSDADCARLLGLSPHALVSMKAKGVTGHTAQRTALACRALLHRLPPYGD